MAGAVRGVAGAQAGAMAGAAGEAGVKAVQEAVRPRRVLVSTEHDMQNAYRFALISFSNAILWMFHNEAFYEYLNSRVDIRAPGYLSFSIV